MRYNFFGIDLSWISQSAGEGTAGASSMNRPCKAKHYIHCTASNHGLLRLGPCIYLALYCLCTLPYLVRTKKYAVFESPSRLAVGGLSLPVGACGTGSNLAMYVHLAYHHTYIIHT